MATRRLLVEIVGDDASLQRTLGSATAASTGFGDKLAATGARVSAVGKKMTRDITLPIVAAFGLGIHVAENLEKANASLDVALRKNGIEVDSNTAKVKAFAAAQAQYGVSQDTVIQGIARGVEFSGSLTKAMQGYQAALVISKATGKNFDSVQMAVNKTLGGSTTALSRYIGAITKGTPLSELFARVQAKFGGQAAANTTAADRLKAKFANLGQNLGTILLPAFTKLVDYIGRVVDWFEKLSPTTQKVILGALALAAAIGPVVSVVGALATAISFLVANPITLLIAALAVVAGAIVLAGTKPDLLKSALERMGVSAQTATRVVADLAEAFRDIKRVVEAVWPTIRQIVVSNLTALKGIFEVIGGIIHGNWGELWQGIKDIVSGDLGVIKAILRAQIAVLGAAAKAIGYAIWNGIKTGATEAINWILGKLHWLANQISAVIGIFTSHGGPTAPTGGGGPTGPGRPPGRAGGGPVFPGLPYMVGEHGSELFVPRQAGTIVPHGQLRGRGGGGDVHIHMEGIYIGGKRQLEDEIVNGLSKWARRNGNTQLRTVLGVGT